MPKRKRGDTKNRPKEKELEENSQEAIEVNNIEEDNGEEELEEPEGSDIENDLYDDYKPIETLDKYEQEGIDETKYKELNQEERRKVDKILNEKDQRRMRQYGSRVPAALLAEMEEEGEEEEAWRIKRRKMMVFGEPVLQEDEYKEMENYLNQDQIKGKESTWLQEAHTIRFLRTAFTKFIKSYKEDNKSIYENRIIEMAQNNKQSLEVNYSHLEIKEPSLAIWVIKYPEIIIPYLNDVSFELTCELFPHYSKIWKEIFVRIRDLPLPTHIRDLRCENIGHMVKLNGVITKRTSVYPKMKTAYFTCVKCGEKNGPFNYNSVNDNIIIGSCPVCQSNGPYTLDSQETIYRNYQRITIQESPGTVPPGRVPRQKEVILTNDLVDIARPGDEVEISGIYKSKYDLNTNMKNSFPIFKTYIEANCVKRLNDIDVEEITDEDKIEMRKLGKKPNIDKIIINSIAPSIYGNNFIKKALAVALFGGVPKDPQGKHRIRGDVNVLLLGDPGTAKSQFLKYIQKIFSRSVYTTGKGASAVGLTASVQKDPVTREWTLEGGALVLADKGICLIDEFDKMNDQDRTSIHEAMEQQSISISKAGIVTSLQARCSVIAAANPYKGRYDNTRNFSDNVELTDPILSRFDLLCVVKDEIDKTTDEKLATFVINSHIMSHPLGFDQKIKLEDSDIEQNKLEALSQEQLRKYIIYARKYVVPKLGDVNKDKIGKFYAEIRKESESVGGLSIAVRHLESLLRIAEAHSKMCLREQVRNEDVDFSIQMVLDSFLQSQKYAVQKSLRKKFAHFLNYHVDRIPLLLNILAKLAKERLQYLKYFNKLENIPDEIVINKESFEKEAIEIGLSHLEEFYKSDEFKNKNKLENGKIICKI